MYKNLPQRREGRRGNPGNKYYEFGTLMTQIMQINADFIKV